MNPTPKAADKAVPSASQPIADLSYRPYDGPLATRAFRWWIVALAGLRISFKQRWFWVTFGVSMLPLLFVIIQLYLQTRAQGMPGANAAAQLLAVAPEQRFAQQMFDLDRTQIFFLFILALLCGSSTISADNKTNALMIYLSKPITKGDYLLGKWMSIFCLVSGLSLASSLVLYLYCLFSFMSDGFLKNEPWLFFKMIAAACVPGAVHASLLVGFSAWSKTPRMAGAVYAGFYFVLSLVSGAAWGIRYRGNLGEGIVLQHLSIGGVIQGLQQNILGVIWRRPAMNTRTGEFQRLVIGPPDLKVMLALALVACAIGILAARARIRAVEVVKG